MSSSRQYVTFRVGTALCAMDVLQVREVIEHPGWYGVPGSTEEVRGLINLRGQIVTLIDLGQRIGEPLKTADDAAHTCVILKTDGDADAPASQALERTRADAVGLIVDRMQDVRTIDQSQISPSPANVPQERRRFLHGVVQLDGELLLVLRIHTVLDLFSEEQPSQEGRPSDRDAA